jgi:tRNA-specific 2-thiouridylase
MPAGGFTGAAGGAACGDLVRVSVALDYDGEDAVIADAGFDAGGCGAAIAAGSAAVGLLRGTTLLEAARLGPDAIAFELGGLSASKRHAAELAADAMHRALGAAARGCAVPAPRPGRSLVAMSGGVDSAVAALLVRSETTQAVAVTLELWSDPEGDGELSCCSAQAVRGARALAHELGIPHFSIDLREEFRAGVVDGWLQAHHDGLTPNPCVACNGHVRLDAMLELADRLGAETLATGHYARVSEEGLLRVARDERKDQSYVLSALSPASLARLRFPLGSMHKSEVRGLAERAGLAVARRRDSQDLCFLAGTGQERFLSRHAGLGRRPGPITDQRGVEIGQHPGRHLLTIGQRHGLGLSGTEPLYVLSTDPITNTVTVGPRPQLLTGELPLRGLTLLRDGDRVDGVRVRAHGRLHRCRLEGGRRPGEHREGLVTLERSIERTAPGQIACLYDGEQVVGHAEIAARH